MLSRHGRLFLSTTRLMVCIVPLLLGGCSPPEDKATGKALPTVSKSAARPPNTPAAGRAPQEIPGSAIELACREILSRKDSRVLRLFRPSTTEESEIVVVPTTRRRDWYHVHRSGARVFRAVMEGERGWGTLPVRLPQQPTECGQIFLTEQDLWNWLARPSYGMRPEYGRGGQSSVFLGFLWSKLRKRSLQTTASRLS